MRRKNIGWLGAGIAASLGLFAALGLQACGGSKNSGAAGNGGGTTTATTPAGSNGSSGTGVGAGTTTGSASTGSTSTGSSSSSSGSTMAGDSVLMHHKTPDRAGVYIQPTFTTAGVATLHKDTAFNATVVQGSVYAQPLFIDGGVGGQDLVIVVTENNNVYALDGATGAQVWTKSVGTPVPLSKQSCGNIDPYGVTGTPVIDLASRTLFLDAEVIPNGGTPTHQVFALSIDDGSIKAGWPVDMVAKAKSGNTTFVAKTQDQRSALAVVNGTVWVPFGGRYGDCSPYHGWVVGISMTDPTQVTSWATTAAAGGIWSPNGISTDGTNLYVSTGNTQGANGTWGGGESVVRLPASSPLAMSAYFAPKNWQNLDNQDLDLGTGPVIFDLAGSTPSTLAIAFGKDGNAYLVDRTNLGSVGAALGANGAQCTANNNTNACASLGHVASNEIISAPVVYTTATSTYVATRGNGAQCTSGAGGDLLTLKIVPGSPPTLKPSWCATAGSGSPMVTTSDGHADAIVWTLGSEGNGHLNAFDGDTGKAITFTDSNVNIPNMRRYNTPIAAKGRIYVPVDNGVVAFKL